MTINPRDYDLSELREMARKRDDVDVPEDGDDPRPDPTDEMEWGPTEGSASAAGPELSAGDSLRAGMYRELLPLLGSSDDLEKPYLRRIPDSYAAEFVVFEWLEFLLMHAGYKGATDAIHYYESIDWLTEDAASTLDDYLLGIDEGPSEDSSSLDVDDHMLSLVYIAKLVGMQ
jgi:flagellar protein FlaE